MNFVWKILDVVAIDGLITQAKYEVIAQKENSKLIDNDMHTLKVSTEGYWYFNEPILKIAFHDVTEKMVVDWIKEESTIDNENIIEKRLIEQLTYLEKNQESESTPLPWGPKIFKLNIEECL